MFAGKEEQIEKVLQVLEDRQIIPMQVARNEVTWFYRYALLHCLFTHVDDQGRNLGLDDSYFAQQSVPTIATHITALYASKIIATVKGESAFDINLEHETEDEALFIHNSQPGVTLSKGAQVERRFRICLVDIA